MSQDSKKIKKSSQLPLNIDDIPIPTANAIKPKSFEELLREKLSL
jgi:hypothetical protein